MIQFILGVVIGVIAGTLSEAARRALWGPKICTEFQASRAEFMVKTNERVPLNEPPDAIYVRFKIMNHGHDVARNCYGYLVNIERFVGDAYEPIGFHDSIPLCWSYLSRDAHQRMDVLQGVPQYLDIFSTSDKSKALTPRIVTIPNVYAHFFDEFTAGKLRFSVVVSGEGIAPQRRLFEIDWKGDWKDFRVHSTTIDAFGSTQDLTSS